MIPLAFILLLAAPKSVQLVDEVYPIPANSWRYVELGLKQQPARVTGVYNIDGQPRQVRLALMRRDDLERLRNDQPHGWIAATGFGPAGTLQHQVPDPDDYVMLVDNQSPQPADVHLRIWLQFGGVTGPAVTTLSPQRQLTVVIISFAVFFCIVSYSAKRLLHVVKRR